MLIINNTDVIEGGASIADKIHCTISGYTNGITPINLYSGMLSTTVTTVLVTASGVTCIVGFTFVNIHTSAVTITLKHDPADAGTNPIYILPKEISLGPGYKLVGDGAKWAVMDASGNLQNTINLADVAHGGTGLATITDHGLLLGSGTDPITPLTILAAGELVVGVDSADPHALAAGATTKILVGGGAADPVWTEATGGGAPVRATSPVLTTPTRTASPVDNDSSLALATTAFAKAEDAVVVNPKAFAQGVNMIAAASGTGILNAHSTVFLNTTNNFGIGGLFGLPSWTPAATQVLRNKWAANVGYKLELVLTSGIFRLTLNATAYDSAVPGGGAASNLVAGTAHDILAVVTVGATTTVVTFYLDGVLLSTTAAQANADVTNTSDMYTLGTSAVRYAGIAYDIWDFNRALTAAEVLALYRNGPDFADKWGSQTSLITGNDSTFAGASNWANYSFATYDETTGGHLTVACNAAFQYCRLPEVNAPMIYGKKYRLQFDVAANPVGRFIIRTYDTDITILPDTTIVEGTYVIEFTYTDADGAAGGLHLTGIEATSSAVFDNFLLYEIGATLALESEGIQIGKWYDSSSNNLDASYPAAGSSLIRKPFRGVTQPTPSAKTTAVTLTIAELLTRIITGTHTAGATQAYTLPTGTLCEAGGYFNINDSIDWVLINLSAAAADTITVTAGETHTIVGNPIVQSAHASTGGIYGNSATFRTRKTALNTFVTYRIS